MGILHESVLELSIGVKFNAVTCSQFYSCYGNYTITRFFNNLESLTAIQRITETAFVDRKNV